VHGDDSSREDTLPEDTQPEDTQPEDTQPEDMLPGDARSAVNTEDDRRPVVDRAATAITNAATAGTRRRGTVPTRTIAAAIGMVIATYSVLWLLDRTSRIITWIVLAVFFAVVLTPAVDWLVRHRMRRGFAVALVSITFLASLALLIFVFVRPLAKQGTDFAKTFPDYVADAQAGRGRVGELAKRFHADEWLAKNLPTARKKVAEFMQPSRIFGSAVGAIGSVFEIVAGTVTVLVLTILMLMEGGGLIETAMKAVRPEHAARLRHIGRDSAKAINGYVNGNLLISVIAGLTTWIALAILRVPYSGVLALWVAFADLIPLVGATLGAIAATTVAFLHSTSSGVIALIFYVLYQQFENQVLQTNIMSRTVALKPLVVLVSVLFGVELFGLLGALLAIPVAGVIKVVGTELWNHHQAHRLGLETAVDP
jgi:predicted PurR-regulated permease PerM